MEWIKYWGDFLKARKLQDKVNDMNLIDKERNNQNTIENICYDIYNDYKQYSKELEEVRLELLKIIEAFPGVHLQTSRVKQLDSLLEKVIIKRHEHLMDANNLYSGINGDNYRDILTDLIGIRLIISYRGKWKDIHNCIINRFPYLSDKHIYNLNKFVPHLESGEGIIAEIPVAYYAYGDDISMYKDMKINTKIRENGYRSVHYIISFKKTYIELQARTIYDEAWSDCDHSYVYKHEENVSHSALIELSQILCRLTNVSNDLGEEMREIFEQGLIHEMDGKYITNHGEEFYGGYEQLHKERFHAYLGSCSRYLDNRRLKEREYYG